MNDTISRRSSRRLPLWIKVTFMLLLIAGMVAIAWTQLPRVGVATDLTIVGQGEPTLVLTRDVNYLGGAQVLELMKPIQSQYAGQIHFRIAHLGQPDGRAFSEQHDTQDGDLTLLDGDGQPVGALEQPDAVDQIHQLLAPVAR